MVHSMMLKFPFKTAFLPSAVTMDFLRNTGRSSLKSKSNYLGAVLLLTVSSDPCSTGQEHSQIPLCPLLGQTSPLPPAHFSCRCHAPRGRASGLHTMAPHSATLCSVPEHSSPRAPAGFVIFRYELSRNLIVSQAFSCMTSSMLIMNSGLHTER